MLCNAINAVLKNKQKNFPQTYFVISKYFQYYFYINVLTVYLIKSKKDLLNFF